jgi:hypothetical protein
MLRARTGADKMLALVDEADLIAAPAGSVITSRDLVRFRKALEFTNVQGEPFEGSHRKWLKLVNALQGASTEDLQDRGWNFPQVRSDWALKVQRTGVELFGDDFRFPGFRLHDLTFALTGSRRRGQGGDIEFSNRPWLGDCIIFTATSDIEFTRYRLGEEFVSAFPDHRFSHPDTRWYNLASRMGTRRHYVRHSNQVLDFFAELTVRRTAEGKRVLLIAKKCFTSICKEGLARRFKALGADLHVKTKHWSSNSLQDSRVVPLITYGMIGINLFESFDAVYCLTGYYISESIVDRCLQDLTRSDLRLPIKIETTGCPRRRRGAMVNPAHQYYDISRLVDRALKFKEDSTVVQAVGRVRPFTRAREVITFQMSQLPEVEYDKEFGTLSELRHYFDMPSGRQRKKDSRSSQIREHRLSGKTQSETARLLGISEKTVRNYEREDRKKTIL